jgi:hypothetical protein
MGRHILSQTVEIVSENSHKTDRCRSDLTHQCNWLVAHSTHIEWNHSTQRYTLYEWYNALSASTSTCRGSDTRQSFLTTSFFERNGAPCTASTISERWSKCIYRNQLVVDLSISVCLHVRVKSYRKQVPDAYIVRLRRDVASITSSSATCLFMLCESVQMIWLLTTSKTDRLHLFWQDSLRGQNVDIIHLQTRAVSAWLLHILRNSVKDWIMDEFSEVAQFCLRRVIKCLGSLHTSSFCTEYATRRDIVYRWASDTMLCSLKRSRNVQKTITFGLKLQRWKVRWSKTRSTYWCALSCRRGSISRNA